MRLPDAWGRVRRRVLIRVAPQRLRDELFAGVRPDPEALARALAGPAPKRRYVIYFTPRSGSSWLTDAVGGARVLGKPGEFFNPSFVPGIAQHLHAPDLDSYVEALQRHRLRAGTWGVEVTAQQLRAVFPSADAFVRRFEGARTVWLVREDLARQAVSLYKMVRAGVSHGPRVSEEAVRRADAALPYDDRALVRWARHAWDLERETEPLLAAHRAPPLRLSYERMMAAGAAATVARLARHLGRAEVPAPARATPHRKLATALNDDFARRLRDRHRALFDEIDAERADRLARLDPLDALPAAPLKEPDHAR